MSQEKIDRYKEEKANRKKELAKQKRNALLGKIAGVVVVVALLGWIGWSGYRSHQQQKEYDSMIASINEMLATANTSTGSKETTVNLEQSPDKVTTTKKEDATKENETTSKQEETKAEEETSAQ